LVSDVAIASEIKREELDSFLTIRIFLRLFVRKKEKGKKKKKKKNFSSPFVTIESKRGGQSGERKRKSGTHRDVTRPLKSHAASLPERVHVRIAVLPIDTP
jgi:hypothetical protein